MEPLSSAAIAISSLILGKALEKTGENIGDSFTSHLFRLVTLVKKRSLPKTQSVDVSTVPADYASAIQEIESAINADTELANAVSELSRTVESDSVLYRKVKNTVASIKNEQSIIQNQTKLAEKIGIVVQSGEVNIENFSL